MEEQNSYIQPLTISKKQLRSYFNFPFDVFEISPCYVVNMRELLHAYRKYLQANNVLIEDVFDESLINFQADFVQYKNIKAKKIKQHFTLR